VKTGIRMPAHERDHGTLGRWCCAGPLSACSTLILNRPGDLGDSDHCAPAGATGTLC
jgi:hypothetical protein